MSAKSQLQPRLEFKVPSIFLKAKALLGKKGRFSEWLLEKQDFFLEEDGDSGHDKAKNRNILRR